MPSRGARRAAIQCRNVETAGQGIVTEHLLGRAQQVQRPGRGLDQHAVLDELAPSGLDVGAVDHDGDIQVGGGRQVGVVGQPVDRAGEVGALETRLIADLPQHPRPRDALRHVNSHVSLPTNG